MFSYSIINCSQGNNYITIMTIKTHYHRLSSFHFPENWSRMDTSVKENTTTNEKNFSRQIYCIKAREFFKKSYVS